MHGSSSVETFPKIMRSASRLLNRSAIAVALTFVLSGICTAANGPGRLNEKFSLYVVRLIHSAEMTYAATVGNGNYGTADDLGHANLLDPALAAGQKYGYNFTISVTLATATLPASFTVNATPLSYRKTGKLPYFIDTLGEIHGADKGGSTATANDPYIEDCTNGSIVQNERCSIENLRLMYSAEVTYGATVGNGNYGSSQQLYTANLIPGHLAGGFATGYLYVLSYVAASSGAPATFNLRTHPHTYGVTGVRSFYIDQNGVLRGADKQGAFADQNDPPINE